jgi:hypothetical protein
MSYFAISVNADGEVSVAKQTKEEIENELNELITDGCDLPKFLSEIEENDPNYWMGDGDNAWLVIEGEIVVPKPTKVVEKIEI